MKRLSTLALLLGATALCAQSLHWNSQPQFTNVLAKLEPAPDGRWLVGSTQFYPSKSTGVITALLPNGQEAWNVHLDLSPQTAVTDLLALPDGKVLVSGEASDCNGQPDNLHENDYTCRSFDLTTSNKEKYVQQIDLRPNPATDAVYFTSSQANPGLCLVFNTAGGLVLEQTPLLENGQYRLRVMDLPTGLYFLQSELGWGRFVRM